MHSDAVSTKINRIFRKRDVIVMLKLKSFFKNEPVLVISALCAAVSMLFVPPGAKYLEYIDFRVLGLLFCLMSVVAGLQECGVFAVLSRRLLCRCGHMRVLRLVLVLLPFFSSMLITNDVALITFVPFAIAVLTKINRADQLSGVIILQTVAANLGSMATPVGNPQSLYLYTKYNMGAGEYFALIMPFVGLSLALLVSAAVFNRGSYVSVHFSERESIKEPKKLAMFISLFILSMLCVLRVLDYRLTVAVVAGTMLIFDRALFSKVDYMLLLTFVCFFIFSGNLGSMEVVSRLLSAMLDKNAALTALSASQVISNVPAAVLLSAFTDNAGALLLGTNLGGLGTVIASLASLISFKFYLKTGKGKALPYLIRFTLINFALLTLLYLAGRLMGLL